jgi:predicted MFS family arabinose efflux permease
MALFTVGTYSPPAPNYAVLLAARVVTSLCHSAFFGVGSVVAESLRGAALPRRPKCNGESRGRKKTITAAVD